VACRAVPFKLPMSCLELTSGTKVYHMRTTVCLLVIKRILDCSVQYVTYLAIRQIQFSTFILVLRYSRYVYNILQIIQTYYTNRYISITDNKEVISRKSIIYLTIKESSISITQYSSSNNFFLILQLFQLFSVNHFSDRSVA
jgi:hypothetical protein